MLRRRSGVVNVPEWEKRDGKAGPIALALMRMNLTILDELGIPPQDFDQVPALAAKHEDMAGVGIVGQGGLHQPGQTVEENRRLSNHPVQATFRTPLTRIPRYGCSSESAHAKLVSKLLLVLCLIVRVPIGHNRLLGAVVGACTGVGHGNGFAPRYEEAARRPLAEPWETVWLSWPSS